MLCMPVGFIKGLLWRLIYPLEWVFVRLCSLLDRRRLHDFVRDYAACIASQ